MIPKKILRDLGITETQKATQFIKDIIKTIKLPFYQDTKTGPKIPIVSDAVDEKILESFKKNYKTQNITQIVEEAIGKTRGNPH